MSDKEEVQVRGHEDSSGDESSSEAAVTKNGFSHDGEPVNRPRKDSSSSSSSSSDSESESEEASMPAPKMADSEDEESVSKSVSKSAEPSEAEPSEASASISTGVDQPAAPQPKSRSVSVDEAVSPPAPAERKVSSSTASDAVDPKVAEPSAAEDTDDDVEDAEIDANQAAAPVPLERKVSVPAEPEVVEPAAEPVAEPAAEPEVEPKVNDLKDFDIKLNEVAVAEVEVSAELTEAEVELSKRETVHLEEVVQAQAEPVEQLDASRKSSTASSSAEIEHAQPDEVEPAVDMSTSRKSSSASSADSVSSEDIVADEPEVQEAKPATIIEEDPAPVEQPPPVSNGTNGTNGRSLHVDVASSSSDSEENISKPSHDEKELNGRRSGGSGDVTKKYQQALNNNNNSVTNNNNIDKGEPRTKPTRDITQIYTQTLSKTNTPPASPKMAPRSRPATDITKLYTGGLETRSKSPAAAEKLSPKKHNMSTAVDKDAIRRAYDDVRSDTSDTEWAVFKFDEKNHLGVTATGKEFVDFKSNFSNDDRGFGYIRIKTGDEMSKRAKFVLVTWVGPNVSVMKKAKMSTDKALMKDVIQNMSVELQLENHGEFSHDHFKMQVDKASGARYGTGVRDL